MKAPEGGFLNRTPVTTRPVRVNTIQAAHWGLVPDPIGWLVGEDLERRARVKTRIVQALILLNVALGTRYMAWRAFNSVNWAIWPLGLALLGAEIFSYVDNFLFGVTMWKVRSRPAPLPPAAGLTVDVFVTTYNEPVEIVLETARAAKGIKYPHNTWVLDDGDREEVRTAAEAIGVGYLTRGPHWSGKKRHAKAGNLINAMMRTSGEFILVLDADQVPKPEILDKVLGHFRDPTVAYVQTPQWFKNIPDGDPFGSDAPLFYGPIQSGKDGWNAAFFCGSNAVLRREALMRAGVVWYGRDLERQIRCTLREALPLLRRARRRYRRDDRAVEAIDLVRELVVEARRSLRAGEPLQAVTWTFQRGVEHVSRKMVEEDLRNIRAELEQVPSLCGALPGPEELALAPLVKKQASPVLAIPALRALVQAVDLDRAEEAEAVLPMSTTSVTEDMATAMRLHALGYRTVYHHEVLAAGLAPEDLHSAMQQRLRWAQGTLQVMLKENPLMQPGLSFGQRLMYLGTMWSYLSGFASLVYLLCPVAFLIFGLTPVSAYSEQFFGYLLPWLVVNQILFVVIGWGLPTWRGQQYNLALFPLWIRACYTAIGNVFFGRELGFVVTPKTRQHGLHLRLVWPQMMMMAMLGLSMAVGLGHLGMGTATQPGPVVVNLLWASYNLAMLSVVVKAAMYRPRLA